MSKGSNQRPTNLQKYRENYDSINWGPGSVRDPYESQMMFDLPDWDDWVAEMEEEEE